MHFNSFYKCQHSTMNYNKKTTCIKRKWGISITQSPLGFIKIVGKEYDKSGKKKEKNKKQKTWQWMNTRKTITQESDNLSDNK